MSTTSLKLSDGLKASIQAIAAHEKVSAHAFMVTALEGEVRRHQLRADFLADADAAAADIDAGGPVYALDDVHDWVKARIRAHTTGQKVVEPKPVRGQVTTTRKAPPARKAA